uniref:Uncharacterized protein n=1 Tax=Hordeum vulgare subsp. vulgare TaxID=112509 RepID=A0A8I6YH51_HORVV
MPGVCCVRMAGQHEWQDCCFLHVERNKIRWQNIDMCEALKNFICLNYNGPPVVKDYFDEQKLRMENARLKEDLSHVTGLTSKSLDHPFMPMPLGMPQMYVSSLDLSIVGLSMHVQHQPLCAVA